MIIVVVIWNHFILEQQMFKDHEPLKAWTLIDWEEEEKFHQTFTNTIQAMQDEEMAELRNLPIDFNTNWLGLPSITLVPSYVPLFVPISKQPSIFLPFNVQSIE